MNDTTSGIALPSRSLEQGDCVGGYPVNPGRIENDAGCFVLDTGGSRAQLAAIRTGVFQPFGSRATISAQQPNARMVDMKPGAHGMLHDLQPHAHLGAAQKIAKNFNQEIDVSSKCHALRMLGQQMGRKSLVRLHGVAKTGSQTP